MADTRIVGKKNQLSGRSAGRVNLKRKKKKSKVKSAAKKTKPAQPAQPQSTTTPS